MNASLLIPNLPVLPSPTHPRQFSRVLASAGTKAITGFDCQLAVAKNANVGYLHTFDDYLAEGTPDVQVGDRLSVIAEPAGAATNFAASVMAVGSVSGVANRVITLAPVPQILQREERPVCTVDPDTDIVTTDEPLVAWHTGMPVMALANGIEPPAPLVPGNTYYLIALTTQTFKLAASLADAIAGDSIHITGSAGMVLLSEPSYQYHGPCTFTARLTFQSAAFFGLKAPQVNNVGNIYVGPKAGEGEQPQLINPGTGPFTETIPGGGRDFLSSWHLKTTEASDGIVVKLYV